MSATKQCTCCGQVKDIECFFVVKKGSDKRRPKCKDCMSIESAGWRNKNPERKKQLDRAYYDNNKEKCLAYSKEWKEKNKERYRKTWEIYYEKNKDIIQTRVAEWAKENKDRSNKIKYKYVKNNKEKYAHYQSLRRAKKLKATPSWLNKKQLQEIETEYALAKWCTDVLGMSYHVDHIVPLQSKTVCGLHVPWNLRVIPATDNIRKGNKYDEAEREQERTASKINYY